MDVGASPDPAPASRWPRWLEEIDQTLSICPQFLLYGNIRDRYLIPIDDTQLAQASLVDALWARLRSRGYEFLLLYDPTLGLSIHPSNAAAAAAPTLSLAAVTARERSPGGEGGHDVAPGQIARLIEAVYKSGRCGLVLQNASRLLQSAAELSADNLNLFAACAQYAQAAVPRQVAPPQKQPLFNPVFWLVDAMRDLPPWLAAAGERSRSISVAHPDTEARQVAALQLARLVEPRLDEQEAAQAADQFAARTEGLTLKEMEAVACLARDQGVPMAGIADAIRCYKVGVTDDPWSKPFLQTKIANGEEEIRKDVKGQEVAVRQTLDILIRSVMGLHGAQASSSSNRPRGVLFFAGPTGVGKTELAKAVSKLVFGDVDACLRFDMSEFSSEHSDARLIGAPPGYIGYDAGGELVNAIRQRPFSVVLFDEIEKAHPRILDKFLQILEDGRLTDGRGDTVYFSEAVLIFTSNLGIVGLGDDEAARAPLHPDVHSYEQVESRVRQGIEHHFRNVLGRPEILNRLGENIVVFDFIRAPIPEEIFDKAVHNVFDRVARTRQLRLSFAPGVREKLLGVCTESLDHGGRGIGNKLEQALVNPLARALFAQRPRGPDVLIADFVHEGGKYSVRLA